MLGGFRPRKEDGSVAHSPTGAALLLPVRRPLTSMWLRWKGIKVGEEEMAPFNIKVDAFEVR